MQLKKILLLVILISVLSFTTINCSADENAMNFSVSIAQPDNQIDKNVTYLDLKLEPGGVQNIEVTVTNTGSKKETFQVTPTNAITNAKGQIDYNKQSDTYIYDDSLIVPFTSLISEKQEVEIEAGESKTLLFKLEAPKDPFDGIILGGIVTNIVDDKTTDNMEIGGFINKFQMIKGVVLHGENENNISPLINLTVIDTEMNAKETIITANIQNNSPVVVGDVTITTEIYKFNSNEVIKSLTQSNIEFAPNSNFDFLITLDNQDSKYESYTLYTKVETKKEMFDFTNNFEIKKSESNDIDVEMYEVTDRNIFVTYLFSGIFIFLSFIFFRTIYKRML